MTRQLVGHIFTVDFIVTSLVYADQLARLTEEMSRAPTHRCSTFCNQTQTTAIIINWLFFDELLVFQPNEYIP